MGHAVGGGARTEREEESAEIAALGREVTILVRRALRNLWSADYGPESDLDHTTYPLLSVLADDGPMRVGELARQFRLDKSTVSRHATRLEGFGVIETRPDPRDGRCALLHVTPSGRRRVEEIRAARRAPLREVFATWEHQERADFARLLARMNRTLEQRDTAGTAP
jgi:DNA-binding MarR family transcriptional regulator